MSTLGTDGSTTHPGGGSRNLLLTDGTIALIRPLLSRDKAGLERVHQGLSPETLRLRFFSLNRAAAVAYGAGAQRGAGGPGRPRPQPT